MRKILVFGFVFLFIVAGAWVARAQSLQDKKDRLDFGFREFTGTLHQVILNDATAVQFLYPKMVSSVSADQGKREAQYLRSLPSWSPLKQSWPAWRQFANVHDPQ